MEAGTKTITSVIKSDTILRIPYFQRRYVWKEDDWERFAKDMESTCDSTRNYFLGAIILKEEEVNIDDRKSGIADKYLVIDGQQRLTTLCIFMKALYMKNLKNDDFSNQYLQDNSMKTPVLRHCCDDAREFEEIMHREIATKLDAPTSNIVKAYNFFIDYFENAKKRGVNLLELMNTVKASVTFVVITLKEKDDEQQIFDTINSLGVPLTTDELLKNFLYEANDEDIYNKSWKKMFDEDKAREFWGTDASSVSATKDTRAIERFMYAFVRLKMWDFKDELTDTQRKMYVKTENVFVTCKDFVNVFGMKKQDLANEILEYAALYQKNFNSDVLDNKVPGTFCIQRISCFINATGSYVILPLILYILKNVNDIKERNNMFKYIETYLVRRILAFPNSYNKDYTGQFAEYTISKHIDSYDKLKDFFDDKGSTRNLRMPSDNDVILGISDKALDEKNARIVYYLYETQLHTQDITPFAYGYNDCCSVQLMPKPNDRFDIHWPKDSDPDEEKNRVKSIKTIGNYFLLDCKSDQKDVKGSVYEPLNDKLNVFKTNCTHLRCSSQFLRGVNDWSKEKIKGRNNDIAKAVNSNLWSLAHL